MLGPDDFGGLAEEGGSPGFHNLVKKISHGRVAGDSRGGVRIPALDPQAKVLVPRFHPAELRGLVNHPAGQLHSLGNAPVHASVLGRVDDLHSLAAGRDFLREALGPEFRVPNPGAGGVDDHGSHVGAPAKTNQNAGDLLSVVGGASGPVVHGLDSPGPCDEFTDGFGDEALRDDQDIIPGSHGPVGPRIAKKAHFFPLPSRSPRARVPSRL